MTPPTEERTEAATNRTGGEWLGIGRRPLLKALTAGAALSAASGIASADDDQDDDDDGGGPEGFEAEVVAPHATFTDDVAAAIGVAYRDGANDVALLRDASTVVIVKVSLEPGGTSGWHVDNGPAIAVVVDGEIDVSFEDGCVTRTYGAGEAVVATGGHADLVANASDTEPATAYVIFLGVPDGEPPSSPVEPPNC